MKIFMLVLGILVGAQIGALPYVTEKLRRFWSRVADKLLG